MRETWITVASQEQSTGHVVGRQREETQRCSLSRRRGESPETSTNPAILLSVRDEIAADRLLHGREVVLCLVWIRNTLSF